jgi:hypothetical protein
LFFYFILFYTFRVFNFGFFHIFHILFYFQNICYISTHTFILFHHTSRHLSCFLLHFYFVSQHFSTLVMFILIFLFCFAIFLVFGWTF